MNLGYNLASTVGPLNLERVRAVEKDFQDRDMPIVFDPSYIKHLSDFHGGVPTKRCFKSSKGIEDVIDRFLNFMDYKKNKEDQLGWYNVGVSWSLIVGRLNDYLIPFAALGGGDMLCFDHEKGGRPSVVVWRHEESREDHPVTEYVAANFDEFLTKLYEPPE